MSGVARITARENRQMEIVKTKGNFKHLIRILKSIIIDIGDDRKNSFQSSEAESAIGLQPKQAGW
jgi:hypothetical protein